MATRLKFLSLGLAFVLVLALLVALTVAVYQKRFTPSVDVVVRAGNVGNQLNAGGDVKMHGVVVGDIRAITSTGETASIHLALDPDLAERIPTDVAARFVPKTLFGERYVALVAPAQRGGRHLTDGAVIPEDRSAAALALNRVLDDLVPLLRTLQPAKVYATLNALATALEGRGDQIGESLERVDAYLRRLEPHLPALRHDIEALADVAAEYDSVVPDLARLLRHFSDTALTITEKERTLREFLASTTTFAGVTQNFLEKNEARLIMVGSVNRPTLALLAKYAPEYPCLLAGLAKSDEAIGRTFADNRLHITMEVIKARPAYLPHLDAPEYGEHRGPGCYGLPDPQVPYPGNHFRDGTQDDPYRAGSANDQARAEGLLDPAGKVVGTESEQDVVDTLVAPLLRTSPSRVPDVATLLFGPMTRGTKVSLR